MMKMIKALAFLFILAGFISEAHAQLAAGTSWVNQRGSVLTITSVGADGQLGGQYVNSAAGFGCQGTPYPVVGWVLGNTIGWSVKWSNASENCNSVTVWGGIISATGAIQTQWVLAYTDAQGSKLLTGTDLFKPI